MNNLRLLAIKGRYVMRAWLLLLIVMSPACTTAPKTYFYSLQGLDGRVQDTARLDATKTYGIGPIFLPESLLQPGVVAHVAGQQLDVSLYHVWAGNLQDAVTRVLASNIAELGHIDAVWPFPWDNRSRPTRQVRVVFEKFSGDIGGQVVLKAKWALTESNGETVLLQKRVSLAKMAVGHDYAAYVAALNSLINDLSIQMVTDLANLDG